MYAIRSYYGMQMMDCYIGIRAGSNVNDMSDVPEDRMKLYNAHYQHPVHSEQRVKHTKWVVLRYPNASMAQLANVSTEAFENFYFDVCNLDYAKMDRAQDALADLVITSYSIHYTKLYDPIIRGIFDLLNNLYYIQNGMGE